MSVHRGEGLSGILAAVMRTTAVLAASGSLLGVLQGETVSSPAPPEHFLPKGASESAPTYLNRTADEWDGLLCHARLKNRDELRRLGYGPANVRIPDEALPMLLHLAQFGQPATRCRCQGTLAKLEAPDDEIIDALLHLLRTDPSPNLRSRVGYVLSRYETRRDHIAQRLETIQANGTPQAKEAASRALQRLAKEAEKAPSR